MVLTISLTLLLISSLNPLLSSSSTSLVPSLLLTWKNYILIWYNSALSLLSFFIAKSNTALILSEGILSVNIIRLRGFISLLVAILASNFAKYGFKILWTLVLVGVPPYSQTLAKISVIVVALLMPLYPLVAIPLFGKPLLADLWFMK